ncbi:MAG: radical SAM protein [Anaerostipes sp.]|uniref:radical SAM protein n=1 Tax=Anaerostipes sp. TaxID=1872530 RepID=UPI003994C04F
MRYEGAVYRPPSEAYSLIIQVTIGCSQNDCIFCNMYKEKRFRMRKLEEVLSDFAEARAKYRTVKKIFLADGDALICRMDYLEAILQFIQEHFPECTQVTAYGSPRSVLLKKQEELKKLRELGLSMIYMGLESGNAEVLKFMKKGATPDEMIEAAGKIHEAGIRLSATAISGLGGRKLWREHAQDTGKVLSKMKPEYVGLLTLMVEEDLPLADEIRQGNFELLTPYDILIETKELLKNIDCPGCIFRSNHASNYVNLRGTLNEDREFMIGLLDEAIQGNIHLKSEWMRGF